MTRLINPNLRFLTDQFNAGTRGVILEGSSRSGKTWSSIDFLIWLCSEKLEGATIHIIKESFASFKTTLYEDFDRRLPAFGLPSPTQGKKEIKSFFLLGNRINLVGADKITEGSGSDIFYINEAMPIAQNIFDSFEQRCRRFWWMDYNPTQTHHWIYNSVEPRPDVELLRTTFLDNPYISKHEKDKILSYEPTHPEDREIQKVEDRRPHPVNCKNGTADAYNWNVYGLGLRTAPEGLIFQYVNYIDEFPEEGIDRILWGLDFGYTNSPTALVKVGANLKTRDLYLEKKIYTPIDNSGDLVKAIQAVTPWEESGFRIWADSADPGMIAKIQQAGIKAYGVKKFPGSIKYGIDTLKDFRLNIVDCPEWRTEQENYKFKEIQGIRLNEPVDDFNHLWDASRYAVQMEIK